MEVDRAVESDSVPASFESVENTCVDVLSVAAIEVDGIGHEKVNEAGVEISIGAKEDVEADGVRVGVTVREVEAVGMYSDDCWLADESG